MANVKISQLTAKGSKIASTDRIAIAKDDGGGTFSSKYVTGSQINEVLLDTSPQLGGDLDINGFKISSANDQDVIINPNGTGITKIESDLTLRDSTGSTAKQLNFYEGYSNGTNYVAIKAANSLTANTTYTLPSADGTDGQVLKTNGSGTLSWDGPKKYVVLLSQSGTSAPSATILENTIGNIVWTRSSAGNYTGTLNGAFLANKTFIVYQSNYSTSGDYISCILRDTDNTIIVQTRNSSGNGIDDYLDNTSIEIRTY